jgi:hypothetical protein
LACATTPVLTEILLPAIPFEFLDAAAPELAAIGVDDFKAGAFSDALAAAAAAPSLRSA